jgi:hypothetical protein
VPEVLAAVCFAVAAWWLFRSVRALLRGLGSRSWPSTDGRVVASRVVRKLDSDDQEVWRETLRYAYSVAGTPYRGRRRRFGVPAALDWNDAGQSPLRRGDRVAVIYHPSRPAVSALHRGVSPFAVLPMLAGGLLTWLGIRLLGLF